jgi:hypothetical protein
LATPSKELKPFLYHIGGVAKNFWHILMKDNLNHDDFVRATAGGLLNRNGKKAWAEDYQEANNSLSTNLAREEQEGSRVCGRLGNYLPGKLCTMISKNDQYIWWHTHRLMDPYRGVQYHNKYCSIEKATKEGFCTESVDDGEQDELEASMGRRR